MSKRRLRRIGLALASTALALLVAEGIARLFFDPPQSHKLFCEFDPVLGWRKIPNATGRHGTPEYDVEERFNSRGLRGPEYSEEKPAGETRILCLGDSFVEGYSVEFEETFTEVLKRELNGRGAGAFEVINAGTGGYSTDQELLFFRTEGTRYRPDLTVLMVYDNDIWFNATPRYRRGDKPLFRITTGGDLELTNTELKPQSTWRRFKNWFERNSVLYRLVRNASSRMRTMSRSGKRRSVRNDSPEFLVYEKKPSPEVEEAWRITDLLIRQLAREAEAAGSDFLVFYIPSNFLVYEEDGREFLEAFGITDEEWDVGRVGEVLQTVCERHGVAFLDPTESFAKAGGERLYFKLDGHWNAGGHRLVGELLAAHVSKQGGG